MPEAEARPTVSGVLETSLYVEDLERSGAFYRDLFGFGVLFSDERVWALSVADAHVLLLFRRGGSIEPIPGPGGPLPPHDGAGTTHLAFSIATEQLDGWRQRIETRGIAVEHAAEWPRGGRSLYFRDPDDHLVELVTPGCWAIY